ncbi:exodeoxyribonuclease III [Candidatus Woesearchaeota archaeon]|nr:exodeoxyribonuclease III [Candidatus Woesearchaeota archaeon]
MKIISWNVNGIRSVIKKGFLEFLKQENPDVICLQETKAHKDQVDLLLKNYPYIFWNDAEKKGYSGTAVFSKIKPIFHSKDIPNHHGEGRVITLEFEKFYLVNVYTPNSQRGLTRLNYRLKWDKDFLNNLKSLENKKPVVFCGDLNVAHKEIDLKNPKTNRRNAGFTDEERNSFDKIIQNGFVDSFREFNKEPGNYTWWSLMFNCRKRNIGWRIDYFCISKLLRKKLKNAFILSKVLGSDHCPIKILIDLD